MVINLIVFVFGLIVGSFLNVVILRWGTGQGVVGGRSKCFACGKTLAWYELLPLVSFFILRGKCRSCRSRISWQYPLVELLTSLLFLIIFNKFNDPLAINFYWLVSALLIIITVYDLYHKIIPDGLAYSLIGLSAARLIIFLPAELAGGILGATGLFIFFWFLWWVSGGRWMGFGDAKLAVGLGLLLGWRGAVNAVVLAFWLGAAVGLILLAGQRLFARRKYITIKSEVPFAPFLILGVFLVLLLELNVIPAF